MFEHHVAIAQIYTEKQFGHAMPVAVARYRAKDRHAEKRERDLAIKRTRRGAAS
jgi:hypothetical protein